MKRPNFWDPRAVKMDWGLAAVPSTGLKKTLLAGAPGIYYFAIVLDFALRNLWVVNLVPKVAPTSPGRSLMVPTALAACEILRRCVWNVFRIENEVRNARLKRNKNFVVRTLLFSDQPPSFCCSKPRTRSI